MEDPAFDVDKDGEYSVIYPTGQLIDYFSMQDYKTVVNISDIGFQFIEYDKGLVVKFVSLEDIVEDADAAATTTTLAESKETTTTTAKVVNSKSDDTDEQISNGTKVYLYLIVAVAVIIVGAIVIIVISKRKKRFY